MVDCHLKTTTVSDQADTSMTMKMKHSPANIFLIVVGAAALIYLISCIHEIAFLAADQNNRSEQLLATVYQISAGLDISNNLRSEIQSQTCPKWASSANAAMQCVSGAIDLLEIGELWNRLQTIVETCSRQLKAALGVRELHNKEDIKGFIDFVQEEKRTSRRHRMPFSCNVVSLGIGNDILAEEEIKRSAPFCKFFGADPAKTASKIYLKLGIYYPVAVSSETGSTAAMVLKSNSAGRSTHYIVETVPGIEFLKFLRKVANLTFIDILLVDVEGGEYRLLPYLTHDGPLEKAGITICQISLELHFGEAFGVAGLGDWHLHVMTWLKHSNFLPLIAERVKEAPVMRIFAINVNSHTCFQKFFKKLC